MAEVVVLAQVALAHDSGLPEDVTVNTWHFITDEANLPADCAAINAGLTAFYQAIDGDLSEELTGAVAVNYYDLSDAIPRAPIHTDTMTLTVSSSATALPSQCAIALSYQGARVSGTPQARRRGRIYLGPWATSASTGSPAVVLAATRTNIASAADLLATSIFGGGSRWCVYSPTLRALGNTFTNSTAIVTNGWIDNSFDTQRRRQQATTTRTLWSV